MDSRNDDSGGSDSLDKSLQKKCVVQDVGQGEGVSEEATFNAKSDQKLLDSDSDEPLENSAKKQKTEPIVVMCGSVSGGGGDDGNGTSSTMLNALSKHTKVQLSEHMYETETNANDTQKLNHTSPSIASSSSIFSATPNNNAFETKVKQISKNLKETTLAESTSKKTSLEDSASSSSSASSEGENSTPSCSSRGDNTNSSNTSQGLELDSSVLGTSESMDEHDNRSKKVRFHPDVKENDGGNRVIPKKKKKMKTTSSCDDDDINTAASQARTSSSDEDMDLDEEDEAEDEEFDLAKTIAEAQDYLKAHPLTFVRPEDKNAGYLKNGLLEEEDLPQLSESSEDEDFYEDVQPENGVERILGKHIKGGKKNSQVEFLLRYVDRPGLYWECEEQISRQCPSLLSKYEHSREKRQSRLMRHVAKRQNIRQRYTDF